MKTLSAVRFLVALTSLLTTLPARAGERLEELGLTGVLYAVNRSAQGTPLYTRGMELKQELEHGRVELRARAKRPRTGSDHSPDCRAALNEALRTLQDQAGEKRFDLIAEIASVWRNQPPSAPGVYTCAVGVTMVAVELKGMAYRLKKAPPTQAAAPAPSTPVVTTKGEAGTVFSVLLGSGAVGAKLQAAPDQDRERVQIALAFRAGAADAPHQNCTLGVSAGSQALPVQGARYQRSGSQETLFGTLTLSELDQLVAQDGALTACETRVNVTSASRAKVSALLSAVRAHLGATKLVQRGDALSL